MKDSSINNILKEKKRVVADYSALCLMADNGMLDELSSIIIDEEIDFVMSRQFYYCHNSFVYTAASTQGNKSEKLKSFIHQIKKNGRDVFSDALTFESILSEMIHDKHNIVFLAQKSFLIERIRDLDLRGDMTVCVVSQKKCNFYIDIRSCLINEAPYSINPVSRSSDYLDVEIHCNVGDKVYDSDGQPVLLREKISTGAEGIVFYTAEPNCVAKIYHKAVITPLRWRKLSRMTQVNNIAEGVCWPTKLLYTFNKVPVGFLMPAAEGKTLGSVFDGPEAIQNNYPQWKRMSVVKTAISVLNKIIFLHLSGVLIGDIQLKNMMIKDPDHVYLIDMDSVQFEDLPCPVGTEEYTPPELWDYSFSALLREPVHEDYSVGILVFALLFCGQHPYAQRLGKETLREEMQTLSFPYSLEYEGNEMVPAGGYDKIWAALPDGLKEMFVQAFSKGQRFQPQQWLAALEDYARELENGEIEDPESYELYPHTDTSIVEKVAPRTNFKKTIREAIIHSPAEPEDIPSTPVAPSKVIKYKGSEDRVFSSNGSLKSHTDNQNFSNSFSSKGSNYNHSNKDAPTREKERLKESSSIHDIDDLLKNKRILLLLGIFLVLVILIVVASFLIN